MKSLLLLASAALLACAVIPGAASAATSSDPVLQASQSYDQAALQFAEEPGNAVLTVATENAVPLAASVLVPMAVALSYSSIRRRVWHVAKVALGWMCIGLGKFFEAAGLQWRFALGAATQISDLWTPDVWIPGLAEKVTVRPSLINSGIVTRSPVADEIASGGGIQGNMPFLKEPNYADEIQVQGTKPTINGITASKQVTPILNRVSATGHEALAGAVSATDPVGFALSVLGGVRLRQRQTTLLNILRGVFGNAATPDGGSAAFKSLRKDIFLEAGNSATSANLFSSDAFIDTTVGLFGEVSDELANNGVICCHSVIAAAMLKQDDIDYLKTSEGAALQRRYKGMRIFLSDLLVRNGATNGKVYDTYIFQPGAVGMGDKPQNNQVGEVASLTIKADAAPNTIEIFDRTRFALHPMGAKWQGTPSGQSATNAELATEGNWALAFGDVKNVGICCLRTNG